MSIAQDILHRTKAILENGHFVFTSGKHGRTYINKDAVYPHVRETSRLCKEIAREFLRRGGEADIVMGPATGGIALTQWTTSHLCDMTGMNVLSCYAEPEGEKDSKKFVIKRGYDELAKGKKVLIVEDVLNTGGSVRMVIDAVRKIGGIPVGIAALVNRGGVSLRDLNAEDAEIFFSLMNVTFEAWDEEECPLCRDSVEISTNVGKGREYLARKQQS